ncbi:DUF5123 domain-containing protein [Marinicella rhabdoformis]|uniref:DUF5123 domain-containing protein n=1 Tax=Marinicella rhabdoformis TaxID=2580566 RepID=UPI001C5565CB|nr:DUF5123 domain-containing protein [Marinicella rhabdoformis]
MTKKWTLCALLLLLMFNIPMVSAQQNFYIDPINGSDNNTGSENAPWETFRNVISYYSSNFKPPQWIELQPGDTIFLMEGIHNTLLNPGGDGGATDGGAYLVYFRGKYGDINNWFHIKAYPGTNPILDAGGNGSGALIYQSSHWNISDITIRNAYATGEGGGLRLAEIEHVKVSNVEVYDTDGLDNNNISGLHCAGCYDIEVFNSSFHDNYDRTNHDTNGESTVNSSNMVFFQGGNISVHDNDFYNSVPTSAQKSGTCLKYKHASSDPVAYFKVYNNQFENCKHHAIQTGTANSHIHHNTIINSDRIHSIDAGGPTHQVNQTFEYNTIYNSGGILLNPTTNWINQDFPNDPKNITINNNIFYDLIPAYNQEKGLINIGTYMSDDLYSLILPELNLHNNCYYNPNTAIELNIGAQNGGNYGVLGGRYVLSDWQQDLGLDSNSIEADPMFTDINNGNFQPETSSPCINMGAFPQYMDLIFEHGFE